MPQNIYSSILFIFKSVYRIINITEPGQALWVSVGLTLPVIFKSHKWISRKILNASCSLFPSLKRCNDCLSYLSSLLHKDTQIVLINPKEEERRFFSCHKTMVFNDPTPPPLAVRGYKTWKQLMTQPGTDLHTTTSLWILHHPHPIVAHANTPALNHPLRMYDRIAVISGDQPHRLGSTGACYTRQ